MCWWGNYAGTSVAAGIMLSLEWKRQEVGTRGAVAVGGSVLVEPFDEALLWSALWVRRSTLIESVVQPVVLQDGRVQQSSGWSKLYFAIWMACHKEQYCGGSGCDESIDRALDGDRMRQACFWGGTTQFCRCDWADVGRRGRWAE